ncbi:MAG: trypsin-like peptidase domain-containing protein, partial [Planctomycetaceae bacterium]|nr:trypsin-like peptidase domain-containing protein [Planctomycetaceae bacterium]
MRNQRRTFMTFPLTKLYGATLWLMLPILACGQALGDDLGDAVQAAIAKVEPSVVRLRVIGGEQAVDGDTVASLVTTGIVISEDGEILTSQFALEGNPEAVLVEDQFGKRTNATIVATDSVRRIVLLKAKEGHWTPAVPDDSRSVEVGQWSIALGRFYAADSSSISVGIISALNRIHGMAIQTDAKVSPVNYGGPLVLLNGTIAGILVPLSPRGGGTSSSGIEWYDSGIGFAIPLKDALASAEKLRAGKNLKPGRIGIRLTPTGAYDSDIVIDRVLKGGPSEQAGLLKGDQVLAVDGKSLE